jgi:hypothetical protein
MVGLVFLFAAYMLLALFMFNRLFVGLRDGKINVRGWVYSRDATPFRFWATMLLASLALILGLCLISLIAWGFYSGAAR